MKEELKGIKIETPEQIEEFIPTEEYYFIPMIKDGTQPFWTPCVMDYGKDPRIKQNAIDEVFKWKGSETKIIKIKMPIIIEE